MSIIDERTISRIHANKRDCSNANKLFINQDVEGKIDLPNWLDILFENNEEFIEKKIYSN